MGRVLYKIDESNLLANDVFLGFGILGQANKQSIEPGMHDGVWKERSVRANEYEVDAFSGQ